jgi:hypothetical protein
MRLKAEDRDRPQDDSGNIGDGRRDRPFAASTAATTENRERPRRIVPHPGKRGSSRCSSSRAAPSPVRIPPGSRGPEKPRAAETSRKRMPIPSTIVPGPAKIE